MTDHRVQTSGVLSLHTSPLVQPGSGDGGGMNVYVRELVGSLAQAGVDCQVYTRRSDPDLPDVVDVEPGFRVVHVDAGDPELAKEALPEVVPAFTDGVLRHLQDHPVDTLHANYWLSGVAGHTIKHELDLPLVSTFHTLGAVKTLAGDAEPDDRIRAERETVGCSDVIVANAAAEARELVDHYDADPERIEIVPPGVDHAFFSPGDRTGARFALDLGDRPVLLFVGRIQPLKGLDVAVRALAALERRDAVLVAVGGTSGPAGDSHLVEVKELAAELGVADRVRFVPAQPHHLLSTAYRAADAVLVPSRSESFGLVALEAAACGTPVVATAVGGLRTLVRHGESGFLVPERDAELFAKHVDEILADRLLARDLAAGGVRIARDFTWSTTAARLRRVYQDVSARSLVLCRAA
ncbi:MAG: glycosyltransferase [Acidimicrobiales bacterium]|nr:glycosyltransferase [Acidimicrobiales bacterium]